MLLLYALQQQYCKKILTDNKYGCEIKCMYDLKIFCQNLVKVVPDSLFSFCNEFYINIWSSVSDVFSFIM